MKNIAIITDTDSSLPVHLTVQGGIRQVPINVIIEGETYQTGVDLDDHLLFEMLKQVRKYPTTSAPSPEAFAKAFRAAILEGVQSIICICVSGKVSPLMTLESFHLKCSSMILLSFIPKISQWGKVLWL